MSDTTFANPDQSAHWNDRAGRTWAELSGLLDEVLAPFETLLIEEVGPQAGSHILDIGCGAGAVTLAAARLAGPTGRCLGVDISGPLVEAAQARAQERGVAASFVQADAQTHELEPAAFAAIVSRMGVMFFEDPVAAFRNLRAAARPRAKLACIAWRSAAENPFMTAAERAAAGILPDLPARAENGPGQFGFADRARVREILEASGWRDIAILPVDRTCKMPRRYLDTYVTRMGPLAALFGELDEASKAEITPRIVAAFEPYVFGDMVRFNAACWMITARAP